MGDLTGQAIAAFYVSARTGPARVNPGERKRCWWCAHELPPGDLLYTWLRLPAVAGPHVLEICADCDAQVPRRT